jgi:transcription elongation factor Elf1
MGGMGLSFPIRNLYFKLLQENECTLCGDDDLLWEVDDSSNMQKVMCSDCGAVFSYNSGCGCVRRTQ